MSESVEVGMKVQTNFRFGNGHNKEAAGRLAIPAEAARGRVCFRVLFMVGWLAGLLVGWLVCRFAGSSGVSLGVRFGGQTGRRFIYTHTYIRTCTHTYMHTCMHACMPTCIHAYMHTCIHAYMHTCTRVLPSNACRKAMSSCKAHGKAHSNAKH